MKPTLKLLLSRIEAWCENHTIITDFGHGQLPDMERGQKRTEWTMVYLVVQDPAIYKHGVEFSFDFIVIAPTQANPESQQADMDSVKQVQSDLLQIVQDFVAEVRNGTTYFYKDGSAIFEFPDDSAVRALPFLEDHAQWVTGFNAQIRLLGVDPLDQCKIPYNDEFSGIPPVTPGDCKDVVNTNGTDLDDQTPGGADYEVADVEIQYLLPPGIYDGGVPQQLFTLLSQLHPSGVPSVDNEVQHVIKLITDSALSGGGAGIIDIDIEGALGHGHLIQIVLGEQEIRNSNGDLVASWEVNPSTTPSYSDTVSEFVMVFADQLLPDVKLKGTNYDAGTPPFFADESGFILIPSGFEYTLSSGDLTTLGCVAGGYPISKSMNLFESGAYGTSASKNVFNFGWNTAHSIAFWMMVNNPITSGEILLFMGNKYTGNEPGFFAAYQEVSDTIRFYNAVDNSSRQFVDYDCNGKFCEYVANCIIITKSTSAAVSGLTVELNGVELSINTTYSDTLASGDTSGNGPMSFNRLTDSGGTGSTSFNPYNIRYGRIITANKELSASDKLWFREFDKSLSTPAPFTIANDWLFSDDDISGVTVTCAVTGEVITVTNGPNAFNNTFAIG